MEQEKNLKLIGIGTKESAKLDAKDCEVVNVETELVEKAKCNKVVFYLKHPDKEEHLKVSSIFILKQRKDTKEIKSLASWVSLDSDGLFQKDSAVAICLRYYNSNNLSEIVGKKVHTELDAQGYLGIKAY